MFSDFTPAVILAILSGVAGIIIAVLSRRKLSAEAAEKRADAAAKIEDAAGGLIGYYQDLNRELTANYQDLKDSMAQCVLEIEELKEKLAGFEKKHGKLLEAIERLVHQIRSLNHTPVCTPEGL